MKIQKYGKIKRLKNNQQYTVEFKLAGEKLQFNFSSRYSPLYSSVKIIRTDWTELLEGVSDDAINFLIWQSSQMAQELADEDNFTNDVPSFAVKQWVRYKTEYELVRNLLIMVAANGGSTEKRLGELTISKEITAPQLKDLLDTLKDDLKKWESNMGAILTNRGAVRAGSNFPYPINGRVSF